MVKTSCALIAAVLGLGVFIALAQSPGERMTFPAAYHQTDAFVQYATVDRPDGVTRALFVNQQALGAVRRGKPLPSGTVLTIKGHFADAKDTQGRLIPERRDDTTHIAEKNAAWTDTAFPTEVRTGDWNFGSFSLSRRSATDEDLRPCFSCHEGAPGSEFMLSGEALRTFAETGEVQYSFCDEPGRAPCD